MDIIPKHLRDAKLERRGLQVKYEIPKTSDVNKCAIFLFENNSTSVYYSGHLICGTVNFKLNERKNVRSVYVKVFGTTFVRWTKNNKQNAKAYFGRENILEKRIDLITESNGNNDNV